MTTANSNSAGGSAASANSPSEGPVGQGDYVVQDGDCMSSIAIEHGLFWETIWNHANNSELKRVRKDPNVLLPGDRVFIPDLREKQEAGATEKTHRFRKKGTPAKFRLRVMREVEPAAGGGGEAAAGPGQAAASGGPVSTGPQTGRAAAEADGQTDPATEQEDSQAESNGDGETPSRRQTEPRANTPYVLVVDGRSTNGTTDGDGWIEASIPPNARGASVTLDPGTPDELVLPLDLGHMDPVSEVRGVKQRLANLGFDCGDLTDTPSEEMTAALREFQSAHALSVTGEADDATRQKLVQEHGS